jgi:hypothetical protein
LNPNFWLNRKSEIAEVPLEKPVNTRFTHALTFVLSTVFMVSSSTSDAANCRDTLQAESGQKTVTVVELYTSEGCDSCPPMDKWFSTLSFKKDGVVPLAFHVDYWDYIGWKDRFGKPGFGERQRALVSLQGSRTVYTPQVLLNGKDARGETSDARLAARVRDIATKKPDASLKFRGQLTAEAIEATLNVDFAASTSSKDAALYIAISENNLSSRVTAGENRGAVLTHDHVVREFSGPLAVASANEVRRMIALPKEWKRQDLNLVAFVQNTRSGQILQAVSVPLCLP